MRRILPVVVLLLCVTGFLSAQNIDLNAVKALDEFRWGVRAFHNGFYNESILAFEKSLAFKPDDVMTRSWLARAYYRSGFEEAAEHEWQYLIETGNGTAVMQNLLDVVRTRRGLGRELQGNDPFVIAAELSAFDSTQVVFRRPTSIKVRDDGTIYVVAFATGEIILLNANGGIIGRYNGGIEGFDRPYDMAFGIDGNIFLTEYGGNRIARLSPDGGKLSTFGTKGRGDGQLIGPQYIASDGAGYLYVTDFGNRRVVKFDEKGTFILSFGKKQGLFPGFTAPTGILVENGRVYVADKVQKVLYVFDESGNFVTTLASGDLSAPEGLTRLDDGRIVIADTTRVLALDPAYQTVSLVSDVDATAKRLTSAALDVNGNLVTVDFDGDKITFLSSLTSMYAGLFVDIERIEAEEFPSVRVTLNVESRLGSPVIGLALENFVLTEGGRPVTGLDLVQSGELVTDTDIILLMDRSPAMKTQTTAVQKAVQSLTQEMNSSRRFRVYSAGEVPAQEAGDGEGLLQLVRAATSGGSFSPKWQLDLGIRSAGSALVPLRTKRAIVFLTMGSLPDTAFQQYGMIELVQFLKTNDIIFIPVYLGQEGPNQALEYMATETGGRSYVLNSPSGVGGLVDSVASQHSGKYVLSYTSQSISDFGRRFIPVELESFLMRKSGRDELGYYAPLEF